MQRLFARLDGRLRLLNPLRLWQSLRHLKDHLVTQTCQLSQEQHQLRSEVQQTNAAILQALIRLMHQQNEQIKLYAEQHARLHRRLDQLERLLQPRSTLIPPQGG
jgi:Tfp pilus assembly protein PilN